VHHRLDNMAPHLRAAASEVHQLKLHLDMAHNEPPTST
jgi:hypothetical protein